MSPNLPGCILQQIVLFSSMGNSQFEVARILGVTQRCVSKVQQRNRQWRRPVAPFTNMV